MRCRIDDRLFPIYEQKLYHRTKEKNEDYHFAHYFRGRLNEELKAWKPGTDSCAKDLRNTLQTFAIDHPELLNVHLVDRFCGHAPRSTMERHYYADQGSRLYDKYEKEVLPVLEAQIVSAQLSNWQKSAHKCNRSNSQEIEGFQVIDLAEVIQETYGAQERT